MQKGRLALVLVVLALCVEPSLGAVNNSVRTGASIPQALAPNLAEAEDDIEGESEGLEGELSLETLYDIAREIQDKTPSELLAFAIKFLTSTDFSKLEQQAQQEGDKFVNRVSREVFKHAEDTRFGVRSVVVAVRDALPERLGDGFQALWHRTLRENQFLDAILPQQNVTRNVTAAESESLATTDAMWHVIDETITLSIQDRLSDLVANATADNSTVQVCEALQHMENALVTLYDDLSQAHSSSDAREALSDFESNLNTTAMPPLRPCLSASPSSPPSLRAFVRQALALDKLANAAHDLEGTTERWTTILNAMAKNMQPETMLSSWLSAYTNNANNANNQAKGASEEESDGDADERASFLEMPKESRAAVAGSVVLLVVVLLGAVLYYLVYSKNMNIIGKTAGDHIAGTGVYSTDEVAVTALMALSLVLSLALLFGTAFTAGGTGRNISMLHDVSERLQTLITVKQRSHRAEELLQAVEAMQSAGHKKDSHVESLVVEACKRDGIVPDHCPLRLMYKKGDIAGMLSLLEKMKGGMHMGEAVGQAHNSRLLNAADVEEMALFDKFFSTKKGRGVPADVVVAKLMGLGIPEKTIRLALDSADTDRDGLLDFDQFQKLVLHPGSVNMVSQLTRFEAKLPAFATLLIALLVLMNTGFTSQVALAVIVICVCAFGMYVGAKSAVVRETNLSAREVHDQEVELSLQAISTAFGLLLAFGTIHAFLFRSCKNLGPQCPNTIELSTSLDDQLKKDCKGEKCENLEWNKLFCLEDEANTNSTSRCSANIACSYQGDMYWRLQSNQGSGADLALARYNKRNRVNSAKGDFPTMWTFTSTMNDGHFPEVGAVCMEQAHPIPSDVRVVGGRNDQLESLLDFGEPVDAKEVLFVPVDAAAPAASVSGTPVVSSEVGEDPLDFAFHEYNATARRFSYLVPSRSVGHNLFTMYERTTAGAAWNKVDNVVYVFGAAAYCGAHDCNHTDYTDSMDQAFVSRLYFTVISGSSIGYGDISPASDRARMVVALHAIVMLALGAL